MTIVQPWWSTPILTGLLTIVGAWIAIQFDRRKAINQELIKKRIALYDQIAPRANDLLCYFRCVGRWQELTPAQLIAHKRELDRIIHVYGALFSPPVTSCYRVFISTCFQEYTGPGESAKVRARMSALKREFGCAWQPEWEAAFAREDRQIEAETLHLSYDDFLQMLAREIGGSRVAPRRR